MVLELCPGCNSTPKIVQEPNQELYYAQCACGWRGPVERFYYKAINSWNNRNTTRSVMDNKTTFGGKII